MTASNTAGRVRPVLIDTDVHNTLPDLTPYLPRAWRDRWTSMQMGIGWNYHNPRGVSRRDVMPPNGGAPGSDPLFVLSSHMDRYGIDYSILTGPGQIPLATDPDYMNAIATAYNDAMEDVWLGVSDRFRGSIIVNADDPPAAAAEIRRRSGSPQYAQVLFASATRKPIGQREFRTIFEAASETELPVAVHPGTEGAGTAWPPTPVGWPSRYMEWHNILPITYMAQVNSLVTEGVFEDFPSMKFVAIEGGVAWLPHLMWRMDKNYKALRDTAPWLKRLPSEYILDHIVLTTQPIEEPTEPTHLAQILDMIDANRTLMFSSDYPHWDFDNPDLVLRGIDADMRARIMGGTAAEVYGLHKPPLPRQLPDHSEEPLVAGSLLGAGPIE